MLYFTFRLGKDFKKNETVTPTFLDLMKTLAENSREDIILSNIIKNVKKSLLLTQILFLNFLMIL